jgi:hypothetical protein
MATPDLLNRFTYQNKPLKVTLASGTSTLSGTLAVGVVYSVTPTVDVFYIQGGASASAVNDDNPLWVRERGLVEGKSGYQRVAFFASGTGTVYLTALGGNGAADGS